MKNPVIRTLLFAAVVLAAAIWGLNTHNATVEDFKFQLAREALHTTYLERGAYVRSVADDERYRDETAALFKWYDAELTALYNAFPTHRIPDQAMKDLEAAVAAGKMQKEDLEARREWFDLTKHFHEIVGSGRYNPLYTGTSNGIRIDVASIKRVQHDKKQALQLDLVVWGAPRRKSEVKNQEVSTVRMTADFAIKGLSLELIDDQDKLTGGMDGGAPAMIVDYPERWLPDFPPQALLATYWMDPLKAEAAKADVTLDAEIHSPTGGPLPVTLHWKWNVKPEWRVAEGEAFEGDERVMPEEMLDRGDGTGNVVVGGKGKGGKAVPAKAAPAKAGAKGGKKGK